MPMTTARPAPGSPTPGWRRRSYERRPRRLERDIRTTRARLAANLSVLTSSATLDELKTTVKAEALDASDDLMDRAKTSGLTMMCAGLDDLKDKAMENPVAVAAIGAGIGWKLWKNPPVASALVGYGLFSLLRGSANDPLQNAVRDARERIEETASACAEERAADRPRHPRQGRVDGR